MRAEASDLGSPEAEDSGAGSAVSGTGSEGIEEMWADEVEVDSMEGGGGARLI